MQGADQRADPAALSGWGSVCRRKGAPIRAVSGPRRGATAPRNCTQNQGASGAGLRDALISGAAVYL
jgi:hypothetical protein